MEIKSKALTPTDTLNPRGNLARELQTTTLRAAYLSTVCAHWLNHHQRQTWRAANEEPTYNLPNTTTQAKRFNQARRRSEAWDTKDKAGPAAARWHWPTVFDYWLSGGLERDVDALLKTMPKENRDRVRRELDEF